MAVIMVCGFPASGKSTVRDELAKGCAQVCVLNRDSVGGTIAGLLPKLEQHLINKDDVVLDNLFPTVESRKPFIELCKKYNTQINCKVMTTSIEEAQFNFIKRMISLKGKLLMPEEIKAAKHPNIFPPTVFFKYKKEFQEPTEAEGFTKVERVSFKRQEESFTNKALILDYDGTLRECVNGNGKYPVSEDHVEIKPNCSQILKEFQNKGYKLLGVSNQSGVHKGHLTFERAKQLFDHTNKLLGVDIEVVFCPHQSNPIACYCRKPMCGFGVEFIYKYQLNRKETIFVGDMTTDKTFAKRCGFQYVDQSEFFK